MSDETIRYYNENAELFIHATAKADMSDTQKLFLSYIPAGGKILDAGCGSGRDSLFFKNAGYQVVPTDASVQMCEAASQLTGIPAIHQSFDDISSVDEYDGVWACASLLHVTHDKQPVVWGKLLDALKPGGIFYASYKEGNYQEIRNGRFFCDMTTDSINRLAGSFNGIQIQKLWITADVRPGIDTEWVNILVKKQQSAFIYKYGQD